MCQCQENLYGMYNTKVSNTWIYPIVVHLTSLNAFAIVNAIREIEHDYIYRYKFYLYTHDKKKRVEWVTVYLPTVINKFTTRCIQTQWCYISRNTIHSTRYERRQVNIYMKKKKSALAIIDLCDGLTDCALGDFSSLWSMPKVRTNSLSDSDFEGNISIYSHKS